MGMSMGMGIGMGMGMGKGMGMGMGMGIVCFFDRSVHQRRMFCGVSDAGTCTALTFCDAEKCKLSQKHNHSYQPTAFITKYTLVCRATPFSAAKPR